APLQTPHVAPGHATPPHLSARWRHSAMITHETESKDASLGPNSPTAPARLPYPPHLSPRAGLGAIVVVILLVGLAAALLAAAAQRRGTSPTRQWKPVLRGYTITALAAADSDSAVLYACATVWSPNSAISSAPGSKEIPSPALPPFILLRSADAGESWADAGSGAGLVGACQLAINPVNRDEV